MRPRGTIKWFGVAAVLLLLGASVWIVIEIVLSTPSRPPPTRTHAEFELQATRQRGEEIVAALERWKDAKGQYPEDLSDLVPVELDRLPMPVVGDRKWVYIRHGYDRFELRFRDRAYMAGGSTWDSAKRRWTLND